MGHANRAPHHTSLTPDTSHIFVKSPLLEDIWLLSLGPWPQDVIVIDLLANIFHKHLWWIMLWTRGTCHELQFRSVIYRYCWLCLESDFELFSYPIKKFFSPRLVMFIKCLYPKHIIICFHLIKLSVTLLKV